MGYKTGISNKTSRYLSTEMGIVIQNCVQFKEKYPQCPQSYPQIHRLYTKNGHKCQKNIKTAKNIGIIRGNSVNKLITCG